MTSRRLAVDWPACKAHGVCAELLPEIIELDEWGYPVIEPGAIPSSLKRLAQRAVSSCPTLALRLVPVKEPGREPPPPRSPGVAREVSRLTPEVPQFTTEVSPRRRARRSS